MDRQKKNMGAVAISPIRLYFWYVNVGVRDYIYTAWSRRTVGKFPRHVALLAGCAVALLLNRGIGVQDKLEYYDNEHGKFRS